MTEPEYVPRPSPEVLDRIQRLAERQLSAEEFDAYVNAPMDEAERQEILASIAWFTKRYPTPAERLAAVCRASKQWTQGMTRRLSRSE